MLSTKYPLKAAVNPALTCIYKTNLVDDGDDDGHNNDDDDDLVISKHRRGAFRLPLLA